MVCVHMFVVTLFGVVLHLICFRHGKGTTRTMESRAWDSSEGIASTASKESMEQFWDMILWMEEILHQLIDGLSHRNPIIYHVL